MSKALQVGIIGASPTRGWARISHVPAVQALDGLELTAVVSSDQTKADAAAQAYGARVGYGSAKDMFADPNVDIVSVCVKVPDHLDLVRGAVEAGKHVYCEWPLGRNLTEAKEIAAGARKAGVHVAIGLQARRNPASSQAGALIADGAIGPVLGARVYSTTVAWGRVIEPGMLFAEDPFSAVNLVTVQAMHTIDLAIALLGGLADVSALASRQFSEIQVHGQDGFRVRTTFDHLLMQARLNTGGTLSVEVVGGRPPHDTPFRLEITGERGTLSLDGGAPRGFQSGRLRLSLDGKEQAIDEGKLARLPEEAVNVAAIYAALRDDILNQTAMSPDFDHAVRLTRMIEDLLASSADGRRVAATDWPERGNAERDRSRR
jgi:predicted dehydrogenase